MGAVCLPAPGKSCGPCTYACEHLRCGIVRDLAARPCPLCGKANGYETAIYAYATRCGHADCIDDARRRASERLIDFVVDLALKEAFRRHEQGLLVDELPSDELEQPAPPYGEDEPSSSRYMLPEFDIDIFIPSSGKGKVGYRATAKLEEIDTGT